MDADQWKPFIETYITSLQPSPVMHMKKMTKEEKNESNEMLPCIGGSPYDRQGVATAAVNAGGYVRVAHAALGVDWRRADRRGRARLVAAFGGGQRQLVERVAAHRERALEELHAEDAKGRADEGDEGEDVAQLWQRAEDRVDLLAHAGEHVEGA